MIRTTALLCLCAASAATTPASAEDNPYRSILADHADSVVTVKFVMNVTMGGGGGGMDREIPVEIDGLVVSEDGLIMIPGAPMDMANQMRRQMRGRGRGRGGMGMEDMEIEASPTDIRVVMGEDLEEYDAVLAAKDGALQLAFVMLEDPEGLELSPLKLDSTTRPEIGEELVAVARLSENHDFAPYIAPVLVSGRVYQPRDMWSISTQLFSPGLPLFNHAGEFIGIMSDGTSGGDEVGGMGGAQSGHPFVVPVRQLAPIIGQALERGRGMTGAGDAG